MDPKANLQEQLDIAKRLVAVADKAEYEPVYDLDDVARLAELVLALDEWQRKGGFSPYGMVRVGPWN